MLGGAVGERRWGTVHEHLRSEPASRQEMKRSLGMNLDVETHHALASRGPHGRTRSPYGCTSFSAPSRWASPPIQGLLPPYVRLDNFDLESRMDASRSSARLVLILAPEQGQHGDDPSCWRRQRQELAGRRGDIDLQEEMTEQLGRRWSGGGVEGAGEEAAGWG